MKKKIVLSLLAICCCGVFLLTGCSKNNTATTTTIVPKTPIQLVNDRINASDEANSRQDLTDFDLSNRITTEIAAVSHYDDAPILARIVALEGLNISAWSAQIAYLNLWIQDYESENISTRLAALEARAIATPTPTATPNASATPTPISCAFVSKPENVYPENGNLSVSNSSVILQWSDCNASRYVVYLGTNTDTMILQTSTIDVPMFFTDEIFPNTYYFWKITSVSPCGNKSSSWWFKTQ